jgi:hypothetical protein
MKGDNFREEESRKRNMMKMQGGGVWHGFSNYCENGNLSNSEIVC